MSSHKRVRQVRIKLPSVMTDSFSRFIFLHTEAWFKVSLGYGRNPVVNRKLTGYTGVGFRYEYSLIFCNRPKP